MAEGLLTSVWKRNFVPAFQNIFIIWPDIWKDKLLTITSFSVEFSVPTLQISTNILNYRIKKTFTWNWRRHFYEKTTNDVQKEQSVSFMYFNRFLMLRYFTAFMFFTNLYWFGMALVSKAGRQFCRSCWWSGNCRNAGTDFQTSYQKAGGSDQQRLLPRSNFGQSWHHLAFDDAGVFFVLSVFER